MALLRLLIAGSALLCVSAQSASAQSAGQPLASLPAATTPLSGNELVYVVQNGVSKNATAAGVAGSANSLTGLYTVFNVLDTKWGAATCSGVPCATGTGGDDYAPITAAVNAAAASGGNTAIVYFPPPPSGSYNICAGPITRPGYTSASPDNSLIFKGTGSGSGAIRVLPSCASPPLEVFYDPAPYAGSPIVRSLARTRFEDLRIDGYGLATYDLNIVYDVGLSATNVVFRNTASGGANVYIQGGYEYSFDKSVRIENVNDPGHTIYSVITDLPAYNVLTGSTDASLCNIAINAEIANFYSYAGGNNVFCGHGWGYLSGNSDGQIAGSPLYSVAGNGIMTATGVADTFQIAGVRDQVLPTSAMVASASIVNPGTGGTPGLVTLTGTTGTGTKFTAQGYIKANGVLAGALFVNSGGNYSVNPTSLSAEPVTGGGLTGATVSLAMGTYTYTQPGPIVANMNFEGALPAGAAGVSLGAGVTTPVVVANSMAGLSSPANCVVSDSTLDPNSRISGNAGCTSAIDGPTQFSQSQNGTTSVIVANTNVGASAAASMTVSTNAGSVWSLISSTAGGPYSQIVSSVNGPLYINASNGNGSVILQTGGTNALVINPNQHTVLESAFSPTSSDHVVISSAAPTFTSGACVGSMGTTNGTAAFAVNTGSGTCTTQFVVGMPTATTGWKCDAVDEGEYQGTAQIKQTSHSASSVTFTNLSIGSSPAATNFTASHTVLVSCVGY